MNAEPHTRGIHREIESYRGNRFRVEPAPPWTTRRKVKNIERQPGEPISILLIDRQIHAPSNSRYTRIVRRLETHQSVQDLGSIELNFDPTIQKLVVHGISIFRNGNLHNHAEEQSFELFRRESHLESDIITGALTALFILKDVRVGDVLDLEFSIVSDAQLLSDHYWFTEVIGSTSPIGRQWLSWIEREEQPLFVQAPEGLGNYEREFTENGHVRTWSFEHTPAITLENDMPVTYKPFPEVSLTTFGGWSDVVGLFLQPWSIEPEDTGELETEIHLLCEKFASNKLEGMAAAIDLVRHNVRYLGYSPGIFAMVPADPASVWKRRFGDCKEKSRLLCWILGKLGVEADPVLVHTIGGAALMETPPSPGAFDHVVVRIRHEGSELWVDPTDVARRGSLHTWRHLPFHCGLPLAKDSNQLVPITPEQNGVTGLEVEEIVNIDSQTRGGTIAVTHTYRMGAADQMRHAMDSRGRTAIKNYLTEQVKLTHSNSEAISEMDVADDPVTNQFVLSCHFRCENLLTKAQDGSWDLFFLVPYSIPSRITGVSSPRRHPLAIQHPVDIRHTIKLNPENTKNLKIPKQSVHSEFFHFSFSTATTRHESIHEFTFRSLSGTIPASKAKHYSDDLKAVSEALNWHIRFSSRERPNRRFGR